MAPGADMPGGPFESKTKFGKLILLYLKGSQVQTEPMGIRAMFLGASLWEGGHHFRGPYL